MTNKSTVLDESIAQPHAELLHAKKSKEFCEDTRGHYFLQNQ